MYSPLTQPSLLFSFFLPRSYYFIYFLPPSTYLLSNSKLNPYLMHATYKTCFLFKTPHNLFFFFPAVVFLPPAVFTVCYAALGVCMLSWLSSVLKHCVELRQQCSFGWHAAMAHVDIKEWAFYYLFFWWGPVDRWLLCKSLHQHHEGKQSTPY